MQIVCMAAQTVLLLTGKGTSGFYSYHIVGIMTVIADGRFPFFRDQQSCMNGLFHELVIGMATFADM
jgi:hypothetical protein